MMNDISKWNIQIKYSYIRKYFFDKSFFYMNLLEDIFRRTFLKTFKWIH